MGLQKDLKAKSLEEEKKAVKDYMAQSSNEEFE